MTSETIMYVLGAFLFMAGLAASIGLHELGHMATAKRFGVKVVDFSVGFGPRIWTRQGAETSYNLRLIPLGGFIRMIGMFPPSSKAGNAEFVTLAPEDWGRTFSKLTAPRKAAVMFAGPFMNLVLAVALTSAAIVGLGMPEAVNRVGYVAPCLDGTASCDTPSPAAQRGLQPGDQIIAVAGVKIESWESLVQAIDLNAGSPTTFSLLREGMRQDLVIDVAVQSGGGRIGIGPEYELVRGGFTDGAVVVWGSLSRVAGAIANFPAKTFDLLRILVTGAERDPAGPVGVVGLARFSGEVAAADAPVVWRLVDLLMLLAGLNVSLFVFNLVPLLPMDGGHMLSALIEGLRRVRARVFRAADPGAFDPTKLLPITYVVASFLIFSALLVMVADIFKPLQVG